MCKQHWAIFALRDIRNALGDDNNCAAVSHIDDAISALLMRQKKDVGLDEEALAGIDEAIRRVK